LQELGVGKREILEETAQPIVEEPVEDLKTEELVIAEYANEGEY
jgi:hypothetical protein